MTRFKGLEGARGWLAWTVVAAHIVHRTTLGDHFHPLKAIQLGGDLAVDVFIIISGFVIYNLIVEKAEPYPAYITRRFMRIYPVYVICLALGVAGTLLTFQILPHQPWGADLPLTKRVLAQIESARGASLVAHIVANLTLLQGMVPDRVLYEAQYFFLSPAWSLSLEWQFYLIAPFVAFCTKNRVTQVGLVLVCILLAYADRKGVFHHTIVTSYLPHTIFLFATGIVTRMIIPKLPGQFQISPAFLLLVAGGVALMDYHRIYFAAWLVLVCYMIAAPPRDLIGSISQRALQAALDSPFANWMGQRSYATYLVHVPVTQFIIYGSGALLGLDYKGMVLAVVLLTPVLTFILADLLHRYVEKPGIDLGRVITKTWTPRALRALEDAPG